MGWVIVWFVIVEGKPVVIPDMPARAPFTTENECQAFGNSRIGMTEMFKGNGNKVIFRCKPEKQ